MTIHGEHQHLRRVGQHFDARNVAIGGQRYVDLKRFVGLNVVAPHRHFRVLLARFGIFIGVEMRINGVLAQRGMAAHEHLQRIFLHVALVVFHPAQHGAVGREAKRLVGREFLLVHPVGDAVDDGILAAVGGDLALGVVVEQFHEKNVAAAHKGHLIAVGRPRGHLLRSACGEALELVALDVEKIIFGGERTAVAALRLRLNEQPSAVGRRNVAVDLRNLLALRVAYVDERARGLARFKRIFHDALAVARDAGIAVGALHGAHARDDFWSECLSGHVVEREFLSGLQRRCRNERGQA